MNAELLVHPELNDPEAPEVYRQNLIIIGDRISLHLKEKHDGLPVTTCHTCISLSAQYRSTKLVIDYIAYKEQQNRKPIDL
jgi:hypothetical protein